MKPTVMLVDFSNLWWSAWHTSGGDAVSMARQRTRESIERASNTIPGCLVAVCLDSGRSFRKDMLTEYKANRPEKDAAVMAEMDRCKEALRAGGYLLWAADGFEADDVIATAAHAAVAAGHPFCIASADKDLLQLLYLPESSALRTHTWQMVTAKEVVTRFGVEPESLGDWLALTGDKSDNVPGCPGVGDKRATELLLKHGDLHGLFGRIDTLHVGTGTGGVPYIETKTPAAREIATPAIVDNLWKHRADVMLARKLVELRTDAPIKFEELFQTRKPASTGDIDMADVDDLIAGPPPKLASVPVAGLAQPPAEKYAPVETQALTVTSGVTYERALEPMSSRAALQLGAVLFDSRLYSRFPSAAAITAVVMRGRELGIGAMASLDSFHVVEGRPYASAGLIIALAKKHPDCEYFQLIEQSDTSATWETKNRRNPKPTRFTYTIEQARAAGLLEVAAGKKPGNWLTRPGDMLIKTSGSKLSRIEYPDAGINLYDVDEVAA